MKVKIALLGAVLLFAVVVAAWAADVTGKWVAQMPGRQGGTSETTFDFKVNGASLTGTMAGAQGDPVEISEGKVEGDSISFVVVRKRNDMEFKTLWKGKVAGDEIKFTREVQMPAGMGGPGGGPGAGGPPPGAGGPGGGPGGGMGGPPPEITAKRVK